MNLQTSICGTDTVHASGRHFIPATLLAASGVLFWPAIHGAVALSMASDAYSHLPLMPVIAAYLLWSERTRMFVGTRHSALAAWVLVAASLLVRFGAAFAPVLSGISVQVLALVAFWIAALILLWGSDVFTKAPLAIVFLLLTTPVPMPVHEEMVAFLQTGSAGVTHALFRLAGIPVYREGVLLTLPGLIIEIAKECSGIRSSL